MIDLLIIGFVAIIFFFSIRYLYKEKKKGVRCVGCPHAGKCSTDKQQGIECSSKR